MVTATTAVTTATTALTAATTAKNAAITARAKTSAPIGTTKLLTDATTTASNAKTALEGTPTSEEASTFATYKTAKMLFEKNTKLSADYKAACIFTDGGSFDCTGYTNDQIDALYKPINDAKTTWTNAKNTAKTAWDAKVTALATAKDTKNQADIELEFA